MSIESAPFGTNPDGRPVRLYTLTNDSGAMVKITELGGIVTELHVPDRQGRLGDVVLGFDNVDQYLAGHPFFGCIVGRYANRIAGARFSLDGVEYKLPVTEASYCLHGGVKGFDKRLWNATPLDGGLMLSYISRDGEEGFPGTLAIDVQYAFADDNALRIGYTATCDAPTAVNLTNHSYFNLAGAGTILDHELTIAADSYTPVDAESIPTGRIAPVAGTPMDFTQPTAIGARIGRAPVEKGYDHNYVLRGEPGSLRACAEVYEPKSGRTLTVETTEPGVQLYTGNFLDGALTGKGGTVYKRQTGFCLECQNYPNAVNQPSFPSAILRPGETYRQTTVYRFGVR